MLQQATKAATPRWQEVSQLTPGYSALTGGDTGKYLTNAALAGGAMIPGVGQGVSGTKLAAKVLPKTVKAVKGLDKGSKVMKTGKLAKNVKKAKSKGLLPKKIYMNLNKLNKLIKLWK